MTAPAWSPDQKLRADATDEQITARFRFLLNEVPPIVSHPASGVVGPQVVREFAAALRAKFDAQHDDIWMHGELAGRDSVVAADAEPTPDAWETFGRWILEQTRSENLGNDLHGGKEQDRLIELGILVGREVTEACDPETCQCAEYGLPTTCYTVAPLYVRGGAPASGETKSDLNIAANIPRIGPCWRKP